LSSPLSDSFREASPNAASQPPFTLKIFSTLGNWLLCLCPGIGERSTGKGQACLPVVTHSSPCQLC
jgi:hypothetical protein